MPNRPNFPIPENIHAPLCCLEIQVPDDPTWKSVVAGLLYELQYWFNWQRDDANSGKECAAVWKQIYLDIDWNLMACKNGNCCIPPAITIRINPSTGNVEQSSDGGLTWQPQPGGIPSVIVQPVPPVTSGVAATKCDAATNVAGQVDVWIAQVSNDFTTATSLLDFATAVLIAILAAVLVVLSAGALTPLQALVIPTIAAACAAAWGAGKAVFDAYWTTDILDVIFCIAYCHIGNDGSYSDAQFSSFWNDINADLPPSPAKMLFMGFLSSVGKPGLNAMAASGTSADSDCGDCDCGEPCAPESMRTGLYYDASWHTPRGGTITATGADYVIITSQDRGDGQDEIALASANTTTVCNMLFEWVGTAPSPVIQFWGDTSADFATYVQDDLRTSPTECVGFYLQLQPGPWQLKVTFLPD